MNEQSVKVAPGLTGALHVPADAKGLVIMVDGSAGAHEQGRHRFIAGYLQRRQLATLQLEPQVEAGTPADRGDAEAIPRLAHRLLQALDWLRGDQRLKALPVGVFGSGRGAAAGIVCAAERPGQIAALVSRAAPLGLVRSDMARVRSPVLLVVGALDAGMLDVTRDGYRALDTDKRLEIVPRATHLFEEAGALEQVALVAADWFDAHLRAAPA